MAKSKIKKYEDFSDQDLVKLIYGIDMIITSFSDNCENMPAALRNEITKAITAANRIYDIRINAEKVKIDEMIPRDFYK